MELNDHLMEVFEIAKKNEIDGKELYLEELEKTEDPGLKRILQMLADAEQDHYDIFVKLQKSFDVEVKPTSMEDIKTMFKEIKESGTKIITSDDHAEFYKKVQGIEEDASAAYKKEANATDDPKLKYIFSELAAEENRHATLMGSFYELCKNPENWVENAEFNHFSDF